MSAVRIGAPRRAGRGAVSGPAPAYRTEPRLGRLVVQLVMTATLLVAVVACLLALL